MFCLLKREIIEGEKRLLLRELRPRESVTFIYSSQAFFVGLGGIFGISIQNHFIFRVFNIYRILQIEIITEMLFTVCLCVLHNHKIENEQEIILAS